MKGMERGHLGGRQSHSRNTHTHTHSGANKVFGCGESMSFTENNLVETEDKK